MKNIVKLLAGALVAVAAVSCVKEFNETQNPSDCLVFEASLEEGSKTAIDISTGKVLWEVGDAIFVTDGTVSEVVVLAEGDIDGTNAVIRTKTIPSDSEEYFAYYPAGNVKGFADGVFSVSTPATYDTKCTKSAVAKCPGTNKNFLFRHIGFNFAFTCTDPNVKKIRFIGNNDEKTNPVSYKVSSTDASISGGSSEKAELYGSVNQGLNYLELLPSTLSKGFSLLFLGSGDTELGRIFYTKAVDAKRNAVVDLGDIADYTVFKADEYIRNANDLKAFLAAASTRSAGYKAMIVCDIDMDGETFTSAASYAGSLEGKNRTISNLACGDNALFSSLDGSVSNIKFSSCTCTHSLLAAINRGTISNISVDEDCKMEFKGTTTGETKFAFVAGYSTAGSVTGCHVNGSIDIQPSSAAKIWLGGVVGSQTSGTISDCDFGGTINVVIAKGGTSCSSVGGVIGRSGVTSMSGKTNIENCINNGNISVTHTGNDMGKTSVGGVLGQTVSVAGATNLYGVMDSCTNNGSINWNFCGGVAEVYPNMGGVAGLVEGEMKYCDNNGPVTFNGTADASVLPVQSANVGGVAGYITGKASYCNNYKTVKVTGYFQNRPEYKSDGTTATNTQSRGNCDASCFGGVFGAAGPYTHDGSSAYKISDCSNEGYLDIDANMNAAFSPLPQMYFGGVIGAATYDVENCDNKGEVSIRTQDYKVGAGGIVGNFAGLYITDCDNSGKFTLDYKGDSAPSISGNYQFYAGGVVAYTELSEAFITSCTNTADIKVINAKPGQSAFSYLGGVVGVYKDGTMTISDCINSGAVSCETDIPVRIGGIGSAIVGTVVNCTNSGTISLKNSSTLVSGKQSALGGMAGYSKASFSDCSATGDVSSSLEGSYLAAFVGSASPVGYVWSGCNADASVTGSSIKGSVVGSFTSKGAVTILWSKSTIGSKCKSLPLYASAGPSGSTNKVAESSTTGKYKIMNFNIRHTNGGAKPTDTGDRSWKNRRYAVYAMLREQQPDILGLCEYTNSVNEDWQTQPMSQDLEDEILSSSFPVKYGRAYVGTAKGIYYNKDKFSFTSGNAGVFYHSDTPSKSSQWPGLSSKRTTAWAKFTDKSSGKVVWFFMSHPDWNPTDMTLKKKSHQLNVDQMKAKASSGDVQIICGDMNTLRDTEYDYIQPYLDYGMLDTRLKAPITDMNYTYNAWGGSNKQDIDYIFTLNVTKLHRFETIASPNYGVKYISDHWPIVLECDF